MGLYRKKSEHEFTTCLRDYQSAASFFSNSPKARLLERRCGKRRDENKKEGVNADDAEIAKGKAPVDRRRTPGGV